MARKKGDWVPVQTNGRIYVPGAAEVWLNLAEEEVRAVAAGEHIAAGITYPQFCDAYEAFAVANCCGLILDTRVDVSWSTIGIEGEERVRAAHEGFVGFLETGLRSWQTPLACVAVLEVGPTRGLHTHYTLSVPVPAEEKEAAANAKVFEDMCERSLLFGARRSQLNKLPSMKTLNVEVGTGNLASQWERFRYVMKGLSRHATLPPAPGVEGLVPLHSFAGLEKYLHHQGSIAGERVFISPGLGAKWRGELRRRFPTMPNMSVLIDGPNLYRSQFLEWHQQAPEGTEILPRNASYLAVKPEHGG